MTALRALVAVAWLRFRGGAAAGLMWLVPLAFVGGWIAARWVPGTDPASRAGAADGLALAGCGVAALASVLLLGATALARDVSSGAAQPLLAAPLSRFSLVAGAVAGQAAFGALLLAAMSLAALLGMDAGGLGAARRAPVRPFTAATPVGETETAGSLLVSNERTEAVFRTTLPRGLGSEPLVRIRFAPRPVLESGLREETLVEAALRVPDGMTASFTRKSVKAFAPFELDVECPPQALPGEPVEVVFRRVQGQWKLRFRPDSVQVGGAPSRFVPQALLAAACAFPLLLIAAAAGTLGSSRLGAGAASALVLFLFFLFAGREVVRDGAQFIVTQWADQQAELDAHAGHDHGPGGHEGHDHSTPVNALQAALARGALQATRAVPDTAVFWRFGDIAAGRAVGPADVGRSLAEAAPTTGLLLLAAWLLVRRREFLPS